MAITKDVVEKIISGMYERKNVHTQCQEMGFHEKEFYRALEEYPECRQIYERAQQAKAESYAEEIIDISDQETDAAKARNRIDTRRWYATKMKPEKFGDRIDLNITKTVNLRGVIDGMKERKLVAMSDHKRIENAKPIDIISTTQRIASGYKPDVQPEQAEIGDAGDLTLDDLLK